MPRIDVTPATPQLHVASEPPTGWDAFVEAHDDGTFCHLAGWGEVFARAFGHEALYLWAERDGALTGVLPLIRMPALTGGRVLVSMPYLNYGGPAGSGEARRALAGRALEEARSSGARALELRNRRAPATDDDALAAGREKVTVLMDLPDDPDVLFKDRFRSKLRSQIRRPMKEDMETSFGPDERHAFYEVFSRNMRDLGTPVLPAALFDALADVLGDRVEFGVVRHEGVAVAAGCGLHHRGEFEMTWASSLREYNRQAPNMLLYWAFMERCIERGLDTFNFGRCTPGGGTHRFKLQWGGEDEPLAWLRWPADRDAPDADEGAFRLATAIWQRLPLPVANRLGPLLARRIPTF